MAYTQAPIEMDMYMELPQGVETKHGNSKSHVLKLLSNLYGQKQAGRVWNHFLVDKLKEARFDQLSIDECVFYRGSVIFMVYVDDGLLLGQTEDQLDALVKDLRAMGLDIEDQGHPSDYDGVNVKKHKDS